MKQLSQFEVTGNEDLSISISGPCVFSNKFFLTGGNGIVRISFCEQQNDSLFFRNSTIMLFPNAVALYDVLGKIINSVQIQSGESVK